MDTSIYIDGYNLFYGRLRSTPYKWLDLVKLFESIAQIQDPASNVIKVKYFTAPVKANFASHGRASVTAQNAYHRALKQLYDDRFEIILGYHTVERGFPPRYMNPIDKDDRVEIWKFEEKQTDVNIALAMYKDAMSVEHDQQILVSNDSDLEPALKLIRNDLPRVKIGLVIPRAKPIRGDNVRTVSTSLSQYADWTRSYILDDECQRFQLADQIPTRKKPIIKPNYW
jgi:uncharacterized LabA/DUF88 family protein